MVFVNVDHVAQDTKIFTTDKTLSIIYHKTFTDEIIK